MTEQKMLPARSEDQMLRQAIEFLREAFAKKNMAGFWGDVTVVNHYEDGKIVSATLTDEITLKKRKP